MSATIFFIISICKYNSVFCSEHNENLSNLKSSWTFSKQITNNVMKCVFLTN